ncbi:MAG TPA: hypothetical protein VJR29_02625 [bacterium]|nr:hypothetical protein [bacterium]
MKTPIGLLAALALTAAGSTAQADHHEVFIHDILSLDASSCAVELQIDEDGQDAFIGTDRVEINGTLLAEIGDTEAATINAGGNTNAGDDILFASSGFAADVGLTPDVEFDNGACASFVPGAVFTFVIDDPLFGGPNAVIDSFTLPAGFMANVVAFRDSDTAVPQLIGLDDDTVVVSNNAGNSVVLGTNPDDGGGCRLVPGSRAHPEAWAIGAALLAGLIWRRRSLIS